MGPITRQRLTTRNQIPGPNLGQHVGRDLVGALIGQTLTVDDALLRRQVDVLNDRVVIELDRSQLNLALRHSRC